MRLSLPQTYSLVSANCKPVHRVVVRVDKNVSDMRDDDDTARKGLSISPY